MATQYHSLAREFWGDSLPDPAEIEEALSSLIIAARRVVQSLDCNNTPADAHVETLARAIQDGLKAMGRQ